MVDIEVIDRDWLLAFRQRHRLTQIQFGELLGGLSQSAVLNWERQPDDPRWRQVPGPVMQILLELAERPERVDTFLQRGKSIKAVRGGEDV